MFSLLGSDARQVAASLDGGQVRREEPGDRGRQRREGEAARGGAWSGGGVGEGLMPRIK